MIALVAAEEGGDKEENQGRRRVVVHRGRLRLPPRLLLRMSAMGGMTMPECRRWGRFFPWAPASFQRHPVRLRRLPTRRYFASGTKGSVEVQRTSIYENGYAVLHSLFDPKEVGLGAFQSLQSTLLKMQPIRGLVGDIERVELEASRVQDPGFKCTDGSISPEPWWDLVWEVAKPDNEKQLLQNSDCKVACLVISCTDRTLQNCSGNFCVFPRSHWLVADWSRASLEKFSDSSSLKAFDVPAADVVQLDLGRGDAVLLHPSLAWCLAPNRTAFKTTFLHLNLYTKQSTSQPIGGEENGRMWHGWTALAGQLQKGLNSFQAEEAEILREEGKAVQGGWGTASHGRLTPELPFPCSYVAPRDRLSWQLRSLANQCMQKGNWGEAVVMLQRLAGLQPRSYWVAYHAGQCSILSVPRGQLAGRAGRKSVLEDAERFLLRAIEMAPGWPLAYVQLSQALKLLGRGREEEIPEVIQAMERRCKVNELIAKYPHAQRELTQCYKAGEEYLSNLSI